MKGRRTGMCCELNSDYSSDIQQVITQLYVVVPVHPSDEEVPGVGVAGKNIFAAPLPPTLHVPPCGLYLQCTACSCRQMLCSRGKAASSPSSPANIYTIPDNVTAR